MCIAFGIRRLHEYKSPTRITFLLALGACEPGPYGPPWALVGRALVWAHWALMDRARLGLPGPLRARPLWGPWALMGRALMAPVGHFLNKVSQQDLN